MSVNEEEIAGVVAPPSLIYGGAFALGLVLHQLIPLHITPRWRRSSRRRLGLLMMAVGFFATAWASLTMFRRGNNPEPSHPVRSLVVDGPYRYSRNPIYLSLTVGYLGAGVVIGTLWHVLLLPLVLGVMQRGVVEREEAYLERRFGEEYQDYTSRVRRWL